MALHAEDFGCLPNGRVLDHVTTTAGSTRVQVDDGVMRPTDVGKSISIPGAVDLEAVISDLGSRKNAHHATMAAHSKVLTAVFPHPEDTPDRLERKFASADEGKRITVAGAGPSGGLLVASVKTFISAEQIELDAEAEQAVTGVDAILNDPHTVILSDYARATPTADSTIVISTGTFNDAEMVFGRARLRSATAQFSSADLTFPVTILGAGRLVTAIVQVVNDSEVVIATPAQHDNGDRAGGRADVWVAKPANGADYDASDSRPGVVRMLASLQAATTDVESAELVFGPGVFDFTNVGGGSIELAGVRNLTLRGAGPGATVLRLRPDQDLHQDAHVIRLTECANVTLRDLTVYGSYLTMGAVNEQMHGVFLSAGCEEILLERLRIFQTAGDGIRLVGEPGSDLRKVWIDRCRIIQNKRSGIAVQRNCRLVSVRNCYIEMTPPSSDSCIDLEPTGDPPHAAPTDFVFDANVLEHATEAAAVSLSGIDVDRPAQRIRFTNNTIRGGAVEGVHAQDVTVADNTIRDARERAVLRFRGKYDGLRVERNRLVADPNATVRPVGIRVVADTVSPSNVLIVGNDVRVPSTGVVLEDLGDSIVVRDNTVVGDGTDAGIALNVTKAPDPHHRDVTISGNSVAGFGNAGIEVSRGGQADTIDGLEISGNDIVADAPAAGALVGIRLRSENPAPWLEQAVVAGNRIAATVATPVERGQGVPYIVTSGNATGPASFEGDGQPLPTLGAVGSVWVRVDVDPAELYFKTGAAAWTRIV
jgi:hypothetical protein